MKIAHVTLLLACVFIALALPAHADEVIGECPSGTFHCYCNGSYVGCVTTIQYCWNACGASLTDDPLLDSIVGNVRVDKKAIWVEMEKKARSEAERD